MSSGQQVKITPSWSWKTRLAIRGWLKRHIGTVRLNRHHAGRTESIFVLPWEVHRWSGWGWVRDEDAHAPDATYVQECHGEDCLPQRNDPCNVSDCLGPCGPCIGGYNLMEAINAGCVTASRYADSLAAANGERWAPRRDGDACPNVELARTLGPTASTTW